jgi:hypothetical protein
MNGELDERSLHIGLLTPVVAPYALAGGIGQYVGLLAQELAKRGHRVTAFGREIHAFPVPRLTNYPEPWGRSVSIPIFPAIARLPRTGLMNVRAAIAVAAYLRRNPDGFDIVETTNWLGHGAFCSLSPVPYVARVSTPSHEYLDHTLGVRLLTWLEGRSCRRAAAVIGHSDAILQAIAPLYGSQNVPSRVIPLGIPDVTVPPAPRSTEYLDVLYVGRAEHRKGTDVLLHALDHLRDSVANVRITFLGTTLASYLDERPDLKPVWSRVRSSYGARIRDLGKVPEDEKLRELAAAHMSLIPSRFESFGLVAAESMRAGTPVIAAAGGALREVCGVSPTNVVYGDPESSKQLASAIADAAAKGPAYAETLRDAARRAYVAHFSVDRFVESTLACYRGVLAAARQRDATTSCAATAPYRSR